MLDIFA